MTFEEKKAKAILEAYNKLPYQQRKAIDCMVDRLIHTIKTKNPKAKFGRLAALEIIGSIGIFQIMGKLR